MPINAIIIKRACGQRCKIHNWHGDSPATISNQNALPRRIEDANAENINACLYEIFN